MESLLYLIAERSLLVGLSQAGIVRVPLKEILVVEVYRERLVVDLCADDLAVARNNLRPVAVLFAEVTERVRATYVSNDFVGGEPVHDVQALDRHFHVSHMKVLFGRSACDDRVGTFEGKDR